MIQLLFAKSQFHVSLLVLSIDYTPQTQSTARLRGTVESPSRERLVCRAGQLLGLLDEPLQLGQAFTPE